MDERLEEIQAKFDALQKVMYMGDWSVGSFLGYFRKCAEYGSKFEHWYGDENRAKINYFNSVFRREGKEISPITESDLKYFYGYMQKTLREER
jgi:hypothetical protein